MENNNYKLNDNIIVPEKGANVTVQKKKMIKLYINTPY